MSKVNYLSGMMVGYQELERAMDDILANDARQTPIVSEDVFISQIIPLLQRPWDEDNLRKYKRYVAELVQPLRVAGVRNGETVVLFTVPALHAAVDTTSPITTGITVNQLVEHASIMRARHSSENVDIYVAEYLHQISNQLTPEQKLLIPLAAILGIYGKTFLDDMGNPLYSLDGDSVQTVKSSSPSGDESGFVSTGYLDED